MATSFVFNQEELLRFALYRPPFQRSASSINVVTLENESAFQKALLTAWNSGDSKALADLNKPGTTTEVAFSNGDIVLGARLTGISEKIRAASWTAPNELKALIALVEAEFGAAISAVLAAADFKADRVRLQNSVAFATVFQPYRSGLDLPWLTDLLRVVNAIVVLEPPVSAAYKKAFESVPAFTRDVLLRLPIQLPQSAQPVTRRSLLPSAAAAKQPPSQRSDDEKVAAIRALRGRLTALRADEYYSPAKETDPWEQVFGSVKESALTKAQHDLLVELALDFKALNVQQLIGELDRVLAQVEGRVRGRSGESIVIGSTIIHANHGSSEDLARIAAATRSLIFRPVGVADLLVVQQHIKDYEPGEVAHIDNVAKGETRSREHTRKEVTETEVTVEQESVSENERSNQTTDRMEVKREIDSILKEESSLKAGASLSASYGPAVEFKTYIDGATSSSKEEAKRQGTSFSRETVQRAVSKVSERVLERRRSRTLVEITDINKFEITNLQGPNASSIYQWVDKVYQSQVYNYGRRVIYDIVVPEPAASFIYALREGADDRPLDLVKPLPFDVLPSALESYNYERFVVRYQASNVTPPPEPIKYIIQSFTDTQTKPNESRPYAEKLKVPDGYEAIFGRVSIAMALWTAAPNPVIDTIFGSSTWRRVNDGFWSSPGLNLGNRVGEIATLATAINTPSYSIGFDAMCKVSAGGMSAWRTKAHSEIMAAYQLQLSNYETKLEQYTAVSAQNLFGRSPAENREIEKVELKKVVTRLFHGKEIDFGSVSQASSFPEIDDKKLGEDARIIRFFEQAFEWDQMQYTFYPYYWGGRNTWLDKILNRDQDPLFRTFLRSGAARVVLSVRPGFEELVAHYFLTGEVWAGGELPEVTDPAYVPILQEIRESQGQSNATPYGDSWTFTVPTTLAVLKRDSNLPSWQQSGDDWKQVS